MREGFTALDTLRPDHVVYGVAARPTSEHATQPFDEVYAATISSDVPCLFTDYSTAERVKVAADAFLVTRISFINEMAEINEVIGTDVTQLTDAIEDAEEDG